jgi:two-component system, chemotaxis family, chemotaxis protein CheY
MGASMSLPQHILVIEDDETLREAIALVLETAGFDVTALGDGAEALDRLRAGGFWLVFLDLGLAGMTGREFMESRGREPALAGTPIVLVSGEADLSGAAFNLGAVAHLRKPFDSGRLLDVARHFCPRGLHA